MRAPIDQSVDHALLPTHHNDRRIAHICRLVVAEIRDLTFECKEIPGRSAEDALLLERVEFLVYVDAKRNLGEIVGRHREGGEHAFSHRHPGLPRCYRVCATSEIAIPVFNRGTRGRACSSTF